MTPWALPILAALGATAIVLLITRLTARHLYRRSKVDLVRAPLSSVGLLHAYTGVPMLGTDPARPFSPRGIDVRFGRPSHLAVALMPAAWALLSGGEIASDDLTFIALSTLLVIPGVVAEIMFIASGRYAEPALSAEAGGLKINSLYRTTFLKWNEVDTIYIDPPQTGGYLQSDEPVALHILTGDGRSWRFGLEEFAAEPWQIADFADVALARAYAPAAMRRA